MRYGIAPSVRSRKRNEPTPAYCSTSFKGSPPRSLPDIVASAPCILAGRAATTALGNRLRRCPTAGIRPAISWQAICTELGVRWKDLRRSSNVRDVRGAGGGRVPMRVGRGGIGGGLGAIVIVVLAFIFGGPEAVLQLLSGAGGGAPTAEQGRPLTANDETSDFVARVLGSTEDVWTELMRQQNQAYQPPELFVFEGAVQSACGYASSASGPFYCPGDRSVYLDTAFFTQLAQMGGAGDFAAAYVIGHEVGHHVQNLLGRATQVRAAQQRASEADANRLQVAMELEADCFAG